MLYEDPQLAFNPTAEFLIYFVRLRKDLEPKKVPEMCEARERIMDLGPLPSMGLYTFDNLVAPAELVEKNALCGFRYIVCRVHRREGRCNHGHKVLSVCWVRFGFHTFKSAMLGSFCLSTISHSITALDQ